MNATEKGVISVRGACEHNLRNLDLDIPHNALVAVTGVSGSGKSSLVFDTLFQEGQRRYLESFSANTRRFLGKSERPQVEQIHGLSPALAVGQRSLVAGARSTVGTYSQLYDHLRLLFAKAGTPFCPKCQSPLTAMSPGAILETILTEFQSKDVWLLAPLIDGHRGSYTALLNRLGQRGWREVRINGHILPTDPIPQLAENTRHTIELVIAHLKVDPHHREPLARAVEQALSLSSGAVGVLAEHQVHRFSQVAGCSVCNSGFPEIGPRLFSFNSPYGWCPRCKGLGEEDQIDENLLIADPALSLRQGALVPTTPTGYIVYSQVTVDVLDQVCRAHGFHVDIPWQDLTQEQKKVVLYGSERLKVPFGKHPLSSRLKWSGITAQPREEGFYRGMIPTMAGILKRDRNKNILRFARSRPCEGCGGNRLRAEAMAVRFAGDTINQWTGLSLVDLRTRLNQPEHGAGHSPALNEIKKAMTRRIDTLCHLGLGYLSLDRPSDSLSGGEARRIRLASQVGSSLRGILYVLDEPSMGLHPSDRQRLWEVLTQLRDGGNSLLVVEHDARVLNHADWLVDIGPGAGKAGGQLLYNGPPQGILQQACNRKAENPTATQLKHMASPPLKKLPGRKSLGCLEVMGACSHNLKSVRVAFSLGCFNVVTGVSGSGKSTLVNHTLARYLRRKCHGAQLEPGSFQQIQGAEAVKKIIQINQAPIGRTPRSNPATYTGVFDVIRSLFAGLPESKDRGWKKGRFSFNVKGGRCEDCQGAGVQLVGMHGLADVAVVCQGCEGKRFNPATLSVRFRDHSILDILNATVAEAIPLFEDQPKILKVLKTMDQVGLGYLQLGQSALTLSGGEAQRVKLAGELARPSGGHTLYVLDEPTAGLHGADVKQLLEAMQQLVEQGHTVIAIEHHLDVILAADVVHDLGPGSGAKGGKLLISGTPEAVAGCPQSLTGRAIKEALQGRGIAPETRAGKPKPAEAIQLRGVTTHNLKDVHLDIPLNQLTVITGVSGSGKSSLAFDTLFAEGQKRYSENLSSYVRQFLALGSAAQFQSIEGLSPTIALDQKPPGPHGRSTLGTFSGVHHFLRLLFSRAGTGPGDQEPLTARMFSFNHHQGACETCKGIGANTLCDPEKLVSHPHRSLFQGAMDGSKPGRFYGDPKGRHLAILRAVAENLFLDFNKPWCELDEQAKKIAMFGTEERQFSVTWEYQRKQRTGSHRFEAPWLGLAAYVDEEYQRKRGDKRGEPLLDLMSEVPCPSCGGNRLKQSRLAICFAGLNIARLCSKSVDQCLLWLETLAGEPEKMGLQTRQIQVTKEVRLEIKQRLEALQQVGLGYLTLDRPLGDLSGGEAQRARIAARLGSGLRGITYILDEPTLGLHHRDTARLIRVLQELRNQGNTVVVVEHDCDVIQGADFVVEMGPGAGVHGGRVIATGTPDIWKRDPLSKTAAYLAGPPSGESKKSRFNFSPGVVLKGCRIHNLQGFDVTFPERGLVAVTGVSGSGKSSLVFGALAPSARLGRAIGCKGFQVAQPYGSLLCLDRTPWRGGPTANPATALGVFDEIRGLFAKTEEAKSQGFNKSSFSLSGKGGRCESCGGAGRIKTEMGFLPAVWMTCEDCGGLRYQKQVLRCLYRGFSIADVLNMSITEAVAFFADSEPGLPSRLTALETAGLGYLSLGQPAHTLSGGEIQRLKLAVELAKGRKLEGRHWYLLDEPTTGLSGGDVYHLLNVMRDLVDQGHTVVVIEHHLDVIGAADWVIDLGPEGGNQGGNLVFSGTPSELSKHPHSHTGKALKRH